VKPNEDPEIRTIHGLLHNLRTALEGVYLFETRAQHNKTKHPDNVYLESRFEDHHLNLCSARFRRPNSV
jgi:hypothetical protein